jgi:hypothetical protein
MMGSKQAVHCNVCGQKMEVSFATTGEYWTAGGKGICCSRECSAELNWRITLSVMGAEYYPQTKEAAK